MHDNFQEFHHADPPSNRAFGLLVGGILTAISLYPVIRYWLLVPGLVLLLLGLLWPAALNIPNRVWMRFALLLSKITNPIITGALFFLAFAPMGLLMRAFGKDPMRRGFDPQAKSYWISRDGGAGHGGMNNQF